jgi:hypothetical protein
MTGRRDGARLCIRLRSIQVAGFSTTSYTAPFRHGRFPKMSDVSGTPFSNALDPMERISETLFGLIMALTFICSLGVATGASINIQTMLIGALGCNLAWVLLTAVFICWVASTTGETRF